MFNVPCADVVRTGGVPACKAIDQPFELAVGRVELAVGQIAVEGQRAPKARIGLKLQETPSGAVVVLMLGRVERAVGLDRDVSRDGYRVDPADA